MTLENPAFYIFRVSEFLNFAFLDLLFRRADDN